MSEHRHHRDSEMESFEHDRSGEIPRWLGWTLTSINRVGFPIVAFFFMWYFATVSMKKFSDAMDRQETSIEALIITVNANHAEGKEWRNQMLENFRDMQRSRK